MWKNINRINAISILIAFIHIVITFFTDKMIFVLDNVNKFNYCFCKIIVFILLFLFWNFILKTIFKKNTNNLKYIKYFLIYIIPMFVILLLVWPGVWTGSDVYNFFSLSSNAEYLYYLNYLTSVFYITGFMIFPCTSGAIILQMFLFGIVCSYIVKNCFDIFKSKIVYFLYLPFFLFHTMFYVFYANRPITYGVCYLFLIMYLIIEKKKNSDFNFKKLIFIAFVTAIVGFWRSESIYLIIAIPIFVFLVYHLKFNIKNIFEVGIVFVAIFALVALPQKIEEHKEYTGVPSSRNLPMFVSPLSYMLSLGLEGNNLQEDLKNIDKVLDIELMTKYSSYHDTPAVWSEGGCIKDYTKEEYNLFLHSYFNVIKNNFPLFLKTKTLTFAAASGLRNDNFSSKNLYDSDEDMLFNRNDSKAIFGYKTRQSILGIIEGRSGNNERSNIIYRILSNFLIPMLFIGIIFVWSILKRNLFYFLLSGMLIGHICIVFLTAPASYFMYYFNVYLCGWVLFIYFLISFVYKNKTLR